MHTDAAAAENLPAVQLVQTLPLDAPETFEYRPAAQDLQYVAPVLCWNLPGSHSTHGRASADALYKPGGHAVQYVLPSMMLV